jgi:predicted DNA-binding transcriptional regulator YafY
LWVPIGQDQHDATDTHVGPVREAIRYQHRLRMCYRDEHGTASERVVWPFALAFLEGCRLLAAWCELRQAFRHFRIDRIAAVESLGQRYPARRGELLKTWRAEHNIREDA